jgi:hypothetical protein
MRIGELLVAAKLVTAADIDSALKLQATQGGRLGQVLVSIGAIDAATIEAFFSAIPPVPLTIEATGVSETILLDLLLKLIVVRALETGSAMTDAIKLAPRTASDLIERAIEGELLMALGPGSSGMSSAMRYGLTERGRRRAAEAMATSSYVGPAPVTLASYTERLVRQKLTNETVNGAKIEAAFADLDIEESFADQIGPAVRSGRALMLYGPPGNGKTSIGQRLTAVFANVIYIPYTVVIDGQMMTVFDPDLHVPISLDTPLAPNAQNWLRREDIDARWVACRRPFIVTGGELTLEMLDLRHEPLANFYVAPLHVKAAGGCLLIDDFGRQMVSPKDLLNRWIVPLDRQVDYMKLHTGHSFALPFEAMVIFSTNLEPSDLMDTAFLRRIPYKLEITAPSLAGYRRIFDTVAAAAGLALSDEDFDYIVHQLTVVRETPLAAYQPKFLVDQMVAGCRFREIPPTFQRNFLDFALRNLSVAKPRAEQGTHASFN